MTSPHSKSQYFGIKNQQGELVGVFREVREADSVGYSRPDRTEGRWISDATLARYRTKAEGRLEEVVHVTEEEARAFAASVFPQTPMPAQSDSNAGASASAPTPSWIERYYGLVPARNAFERVVRVLLLPMLEVGEHRRFRRTPHGTLKLACSNCHTSCNCAEHAVLMVTDSHYSARNRLRCMACSGPVSFRERAPTWRRVGARLLLLGVACWCLYWLMWPNLQATTRRYETAWSTLREAGLNTDHDALDRVHARTKEEWYAALNPTTAEQRSVIDEYLAFADDRSRREFERRNFSDPLESERSMASVTAGLLLLPLIWRIGRPRGGLECEKCHSYLIL